MTRLLDKDQKKWLLIILVVGAVVFGYFNSRTMSVSNPEIDSWKVSLSQGISDYKIGSLDFSVGTPTFICNDLARSQYVFGSSDNSCWRLELNGINYLDGDTIVVNPYLEVKINLVQAVHYSSSQVVYPKGTRSDWKVLLTFHLLNRDFFSAKILDVTEVMIGREKNVSITVQNDLANNLDGGFIVYKMDDLVHDEKYFEYAKNFDRGSTIKLIPLDTDKFGKTTLTITPYINLFSDEGSFRIYANEISKTYDIVSYVVPSQNTSQVLSGTGSTPVTPNVSGLTPAMIILIAIVVIGLGIIFFGGKKHE